MLQQNWLTLTKAKYVKIHLKQNKTKQIRIQIGSNTEQTVVDLGYSDHSSVVNALTIAFRSF